MSHRDEQYDRAIPLAFLPPVMAAPLLGATSPQDARIALILASAGLVPVALASRTPDMAQLSGWPWSLHRHVGLLRIAAAVAYALFLAMLAGLAPEVLGDPVRAAVTATLTGAAGAHVLPAGSTPAGARSLPRHEVVAGAARRSTHVLLLAALPAWVWGGLLPVLAIGLAAVAAVLTELTSRRTARPLDGDLPVVAGFDRASR